MRLHGGDLSIRSRVGEGTRVTVRLPLDCERARPVKKSAAAPSAGVVSLFGSRCRAAPASAEIAREAAPQPDRQRYSGEEKCLSAAMPRSASSRAPQAPAEHCCSAVGPRGAAADGFSRDPGRGR